MVDLLDITRISRGKMEMHCAVVDVHQVLDNAVCTCEADFRGKRIEVRKSLAASSSNVWGDRARLLQTFWNLLKNAAKFTPEGGIVDVVTSETDSGRIRIEFRDSGIGLDPPTLDLIFKPFEQGNAMVTRRFGGLGLGLSISKALAEIHGGTISAESQGMGHGATFIVELPLSKVELTSATVIEPAEVDAATTKGKAPRA